MFPTIPNLPEVTTKQMIEVDRLMMEEYQINLFQMMENAGRSLAILANRLFLDQVPRDKKILVLAGSGGNGGGAITAARRLANWGAQIDLGLMQSGENMKDVPKQQLQILSRLVDVNYVKEDEVDDTYDLIIDGMIGYSVNGPPRGRTTAFIQKSNSLTCPKLSLDVPSGYDATTGFAAANSFQANATMTIAMPKFGMSRAENKSYIGDLYCADISVPPSLYKRLDPQIEPNVIFGESDIVRVGEET